MITLKALRYNHPSPGWDLYHNLNWAACRVRYGASPISLSTRVSVVYERVDEVLVEHR